MHFGTVRPHSNEMFCSSPISIRTAFTQTCKRQNWYFSPRIYLFPITIYNWTGEQIQVLFCLFANSNNNSQAEKKVLIKNYCCHIFTLLDCNYQEIENIMHAAEAILLRNSPTVKLPIEMNWNQLFVVCCVCARVKYSCFYIVQNVSIHSFFVCFVSPRYIGPGIIAIIRLTMLHTQLAHFTCARHTIFARLHKFLAN